MMLNTKQNAAMAEALSEQLDVKGRSLWQDAWRRFRRNKAALASLMILSMVLLFVLIAPFLSPYGYA